VWILLAMAVGLCLGRLVPGMNDAPAKIEIGGISLPIALGLLVMMYPVLAKVRYDKLDPVTGDKKLMLSSLVINWIAAPRSCSRWRGSSFRTCPSTAPS
jgi:ACR3 family arsenite transporter